MSTPWVVAFALLAAVTASLAVVVTGVLRQAVAVMNSEPATAELATGLTVEAEPMGYDQVGRTIDSPPGMSWADLGRCTVAYLEVGCEGCHQLAADTLRNRRRLASSGQKLLYVVDRLDGPFLRLPDAVHTVEDSSGSVARAWDIRASPIAYHVSDSGFVMGATHPTTLRLALALKDRVDASTGGVALKHESTAASAHHHH